MTGYFDVNSFCDTLDSYSVFEDVADSLDFRAVGIKTDKPAEELKTAKQKMAENNKKENVKPFKTSLKKRGKKPGQKGKCSACGSQDHNKRTCTFFPKSG